MNEICGSRLYLKPFDASCITLDHLRWLNDKVALRYSRQRLRVHTHESCLEYLHSFERTPHFYWSVQRISDGRPIGSMTAYVDSIAQTADMGILIGDPDSKGKGLGSEAWGLGLRTLFEKEHLRKVTAGTLALNLPMIHICHKWGMLREGIVREYELIDNQPVDQWLFGLLSREWFANHATIKVP
jgi:RimJ/RimL family protein N-acetyltransferase